MTMTKEEFLKRLQENKQDFTNDEELVDYVLPVLQFYLDNYRTIVVNGEKLKIKKDLSFKNVSLTKYAFEQVRNQIITENE